MVPTPSPAALRAFVRRQTRLLPVAGLPTIRLHQAADVTETWHAAVEFLRDPDIGLPFWAFPWAGGLAVASHLNDHPEAVAGLDVLDIATGSGICAIVAARAGAASVRAVDIDPLAEAAAHLNAQANEVHVTIRRVDLLDSPPPEIDVILAGDICYEETMSNRMLTWLRQAASAGTRVLVGDPGRAYLPAGLRRVGAYEVSTSRELEATETRMAAVYEIPPG